MSVDVWNFQTLNKEELESFGNGSNKFVEQEVESSTTFEEVLLLLRCETGCDPRGSVDALLRSEFLCFRKVHIER